MRSDIALRGAETDQGSGRSFWGGMVVGWTAFLAINLILMSTMEEAYPREIALIAVVNVGCPALVSVLVALNRRRLLRPGWSLARTIAIHVVVGLLFALTTSGLAMGIIRAVGAVGALPEGPTPQFLPIFFTSLFIYAIFFGFLMWSESIRRVQESHRVAAREAVLRAEAEARAIRARFNPHFVFNTLHSLMLLVRADPGRAERAIEDVATLIRYATIIQRRDIDAVPLAKELEIVRRYVALERLRLQHRLDVAWAVELEPGAVTIPAFALQTVVENAIRHGLEPLPEGGRIDVTLRSADGVVEVSVVDDGRGARGADVTSAHGRGLDLLRDRLDARYGDRGTLMWDTAPGQGFRVTLRFPEEAPEAVPSLDVIDERNPADQTDPAVAVESGRG